MAQEKSLLRANQSNLTLRAGTSSDALSHLLRDFDNVLEQAKEFPDARIGNPVIDVQAIPAVQNEARAPQDGELLGDIRLAQAQHRCEVADALLPLRESAEDLQPDRVAEDFQHLRL